jgi:hypothetical protein
MSEEIIVVTGLPRSGTSLMMQILEKVPLEIMTDELRKSDVNNPEGYYELEAVKGIVRNNQFLNDCQGKVVKIVAPLCQFIDLSLKYKIVFVRRDMEEILMSQEKMLGKNQLAEREKFKTIYELHLKKTYQFFLTNQIPFIDILYSNLLNSPEPEISKLINFLNITSTSNNLVNCVKKDLYRNKLKEK